MKNKDEERVVKRMELESIMEEYYKLCKEPDYDFIDDIKDIIYDITGGTEIN